MFSTKWMYLCHVSAAPLCVCLGFSHLVPPVETHHGWIIIMSVALLFFVYMENIISSAAARVQYFMAQFLQNWWRTSRLPPHRREHVAVFHWVIKYCSELWGSLRCIDTTVCFVLSEPGMSWREWGKKKTSDKRSHYSRKTSRSKTSWVEPAATLGRQDQFRLVMTWEIPKSEAKVPR